MTNPLTRPEPLYPLFAGIDTLPGIGPKLSKSLSNMGIQRVLDLVLTLPHNLIHRRFVETVQGLELPAIVTVQIRIGRHRAPRSPGRPYIIEATDSRGFQFQLVWFRSYGNNLSKTLPEGSHMAISGKAESWDGTVQIVQPDHILPAEKNDQIPEIEPVYPLTKGVSNRVMRQAIGHALTRLPDTTPEWIDHTLLEREAWPSWRDALWEMHHPSSIETLSPDHPARRRLAYDELFAHQLTLAKARSKRKSITGRANVLTGKIRAQLLASLPYQLTGAQTRSLDEIEADLASSKRMHRLLQGDVGAGKTVVALMAMAMVVEAGGQAALMAPTEILARQHYAALSPLAAPAGLRLEILTGRDTGAARQEKLTRMARGEVDIVVGTHALFSKDVALKDLRLAIIDEQHRFGVAQRSELSAKGDNVDLLVMTATPIPRSLAMASFGDLDISVLDEKPPGRQPIQTALVAVERVNEVVDHLKNALSNGAQAYWVCPLVDESDKLDYVAAQARFEALKQRLGERVGLVHGQMPAAERDAVMAQFRDGSLDVLVATTVIEVGVDVPNATIMVIEQAEVFGLSQLHQLRGRVGRGANKSSCLLVYGPNLTETARKRLKALRDSEDGFALAEADLEMRGAGDVIGTAQSGLPKFRIADLERQAGLMEVAQKDARALIALDREFSGSRGEAACYALHIHGHEKAMAALLAG